MCQQLAGYRSRCHPGNGLAGRGTPAAPVIPESVFLFEAVIRMPRTVHILDRAVIPGTLVGVSHHHGNRGAGGLSFKYSGKDFHLIALVSCGGKFTLPRLSSI